MSGHTAGTGESGRIPPLRASVINVVGIARKFRTVKGKIAVPLTTPSHAIILTGTYPQFHQVNYVGDPLGKDLPSLPDILHQNGYRTAAFVGALVLEPNKLALGFERGFDIYNAGFHRRIGKEDRYQSLERRDDEVVRRVLAWLRKQSGGPFFLWVHLYDSA